jgi:hypothetical protein
VKAIRQTDGSVLIVQRSGGSNMMVGKVTNGSYKRAAGAPDWTVTVNDDTVQVSDTSGGTSASCSF